jgi:hypothetical protein
MSRNINQVYSDNPIATLANNDLIYLGVSGVDGAIQVSDFITSLSQLGFVEGPGSATDNALARFDGTTGKLIQNSVATLDDSGNLSSLLSISLSGSATSLNFNGTSSNTITTLAGVSGATGTAASPLTLSMGASGNSTGSNAGAAGAAFAINGSNGGNSGTGTPGNGGSIIITAGSAGSSTTTGGAAAGVAQLIAGSGVIITSGATQAGSGQAASIRGGAGGAQQGTGKGGTGGNAIVSGGAGGAATNGNGGNSGGVSISGGTPGAATSTNGTGGTAGNITLLGASGGNGNGSGSGGAGSTITLSAGFGGAAGATGTGGVGAPVVISAGSGGAAPGGTGGSGANVLITSGAGGTGSVAGSAGNIRLSTTGTSVDLKSTGSSATELRFYNTAASQYVGFIAGTLAGDTTWVLPTSNVTNGLMTTDGSNNMSFTLTPSGLTSLGVADLSFSAGLIAAINGVTLTGVTSGSPIVLSPNNGFVAINDLGNTIATPLRFYNSAGTQYVGFKAGTLAGSTTWTWMTSDAAGVIVSNGSGALSLTASPSVTSMTIGNLSLSGSTISTSQTTLDFSATGSSSVITLSSNNGAVAIRDTNNTHSIPLRFYDDDSPSNHYVSLRAASALGGNVDFVLPYTDREGVIASDGSGNLTLEYAPAIQKPIVNFNSTSKTLALSDKNTFQICNNGSTQTITIPPNASVNFLDGVEVEFFQQGAGQIVFVAGAGVTILSAFGNLKVGAQYTGAVIKQLVTDTWSLVGNLTA